MANGNSNAEEARYARQIQLREIGKNGQEKLKKASILIIGLGGLGSSAAYYLAASGVGRIGLMDDDTIQPSNLNRQILHSSAKLGQSKALSACAVLHDLNPYIQLDPYTNRFTREAGSEIANHYDLVIDATDSFESKYLINDICVELNKPDIYGAASGFEGRITVLSFNKGPCLRCLFSEPPQNQPNNPPILGTVTGVIGSLQANEAIKIILGVGDVLSDRLITFNARKAEFTHFYISKNPNCGTCK